MHTQDPFLCGHKFYTQLLYLSLYLCHLKVCGLVSDVLQTENKLLLCTENLPAVLILILFFFNGGKNEEACMPYFWLLSIWFCWISFIVNYKFSPIFSNLAENSCTNCCLYFCIPSFLVHLFSCIIYRLQKYIFLNRTKCFWM